MASTSSCAGLKSPTPECFGTDGFSLATYGTGLKSSTPKYFVKTLIKEVKMKITGVLLALLCSTNLFAYDTNLAKEINKTFSQYSLENLNNSKILVYAETVMKMLKKGDDFIFLDIRTVEEISIVGLGTKNRLEIPFDVLFEKENLDRLPTDKPIVIICYSGSRALQAATSLEMIEFKNAKVLYGGIIALAKSDSIKNIAAE
jgi:rhodanese-related sulfurtransferase